MQIPTLVPRVTLIFLRYLFACDLSFTFCDFDTVVFLIITTVVTLELDGGEIAGSLVL